MSDDKAEIEYYIVQPVDVKLIVLFCILILLIFNVVCACTLYGKWRKRRQTCRFEYLRQGRSAYLCRHKPPPISVRSKYDRLHRNMSNRIRSIRNIFPNNRRGQNEQIRLQIKQLDGSKTKGILTQNPRHSGKGKQPKKKVTVMEELCSNTKLYSFSKISHDYSVVKKPLRGATSAHHPTTVESKDRDQKSPRDTQQVRSLSGRRRNRIPLKDSEMQNSGEKGIKENGINESDEHFMNLGADPTSENNICTLSTLFITHSDDVSKALSRLDKSDETN